LANKEALKKAKKAPKSETKLATDYTPIKVNGVLTYLNDVCIKDNATRNNSMLEKNNQTFDLMKEDINRKKRMARKIINKNQMEKQRLDELNKLKAEKAAQLAKEKAAKLAKEKAAQLAKKKALKIKKKPSARPVAENPEIPARDHPRSFIIFS